MNQHNQFWFFKNKELRRFDNDLEKQRQKDSDIERADDIASRTHLDLNGRKGFVGLARSMPSYFRHTGNRLYARWVRGEGK